MPAETPRDATRRPAESVGWIGNALDFQLTHVPERPGWRWDAWLGRRLVEHGWTRTKFGARFAMWRCDRRWALEGRRG